MSKVLFPLERCSLPGLQATTGAGRLLGQCRPGSAGLDGEMVVFGATPKEKHGTKMKIFQLRPENISVLVSNICFMFIPKFWGNGPI